MNWLQEKLRRANEGKRLTPSDLYGRISKLSDEQAEKRGHLRDLKETLSVIQAGADGDPKKTIQEIRNLETELEAYPGALKALHLEAARLEKQQRLEALPVEMEKEIEDFKTAWVPWIIEIYSERLRAKFDRKRIYLETGHPVPEPEKPQIHGPHAHPSAEDLVLNAIDTAQRMRCHVSKPAPIPPASEAELNRRQGGNIVYGKNIVRRLPAAHRGFFMETEAQKSMEMEAIKSEE